MQNHSGSEGDVFDDDGIEERNWSAFEEASLLALICKGRAPSFDENNVKGRRRYRATARGRGKRAAGDDLDPLQLASDLNQALNSNGNYRDDIPVDSVRAKYLQWKKEKVGAFALLRRQMAPCLTRRVKLAFQRNLDFDGTEQEWERGRKKKEQRKPAGPCRRPMDGVAKMASTASQTAHKRFEECRSGGCYTATSSVDAPHKQDFSNGRGAQDLATDVSSWEGHATQGHVTFDDSRQRSTRPRLLTDNQDRDPYPYRPAGAMVPNNDRQLNLRGYTVAPPDHGRAGRGEHESIYQHDHLNTGQGERNLGDRNAFASFKPQDRPTGSTTAHQPNRQNGMSGYYGSHGMYTQHPQLDGRREDARDGRQIFQRSVGLFEAPEIIETEWRGGFVNPPTDKTYPKATYEGGHESEAREPRF